jgi:hypothetical protein
VRRRAGRVLRSVDEADQVTFIEVPEPMNFIAWRDAPGQSSHHLRNELEAHVHATGPDVEQQVARRGHRAMLRP